MYPSVRAGPRFDSCVALQLNLTWASHPPQRKLRLSLTPSTPTSCLRRSTRWISGPISPHTFLKPVSKHLTRSVKPCNSYYRDIFGHQMRRSCNPAISRTRSHAEATSVGGASLHQVRQPHQQRSHHPDTAAAHPSRRDL